MGNSFISQPWNDPRMLPLGVRMDLSVVIIESSMRRNDEPKRPQKVKSKLIAAGNGEYSRRKRAVIRQWGSVCWLCFDKIDLALRLPDPYAFTLDHVLPKSRGGTYALENLRPAHKRCNEQRGNKIV